MTTRPLTPEGAKLTGIIDSMTAAQLVQRENIKPASETATNPAIVALSQDPSRLR